jgi:glycosyltransferase involved in cell wall biosynthesis
MDKKLILFGAAKITDKRKGIDYFIDSCKVLVNRYPELKEELGVVVYGKDSEQLKPLLPFEVYPLNYISNEKEILNVYNSVDLFVTPSLEENLPNTIMEAMACGVPCVGFNVGGIPEMIDHLHNGYVADYKSVEDFANGIHWALSESEYQSLSEEACRKVASSYSESAIAKRYIEIYNKIMGDND